MMEIYHQAAGAIERSKAPLLVVAAGGGADAFASTLGLAGLLKKMDKPVHIVSADKEAPSQYTFLNRDRHPVHQSLEHLVTFVIHVNTATTPLEEISYDASQEELRVFLSPKEGMWSDKDIRFSKTRYRHDLIICVGAKNLEACAHLFEAHPDFFYRTPIINIDHTPHNDHFGHYNLVDVTASACGEVCHDWVSAVSEELLDEHTATHFLAGMMAKTKSFRSPRVTPKTLQVASSLMAKGARRDEIVEHLYRTRSVETLRLWGRALARLKSDEERGMVWTLLSAQDFMHAGIGEEGIRGVTEELMGSSPSVQVALLIYEDQSRDVNAILHTRPPHDAIVLAMPFKPAGTHEEVQLRLGKKTLPEVEKMILAQLQKSVKRR